MKLALKDKILFAVGGLGENTTFQALTAWLVFFWSGRGDPSAALVPIGQLGILLGIGRIIEAFDDPIIGHLSDKTRSRFGRRFPYIFFGAPFVALSFALLWVSPTQSQSLVNALYFFFVLQLFFFAYTIVTAPYEGILPEIAKTSEDRVSTSSWRVVFGVIGAAFGLVGSGILIQKFGYTSMGIVLGAISLAAFWVAIFGIRKRLSTKSTSSTLSLSKAVSATLKNKQFLVFSLAFILFSLGLNLLTSLLPFYVKVILNEKEGVVSLFSGLVLIGMIGALPFHNVLAKLKGKKWVYSYSMLLLALLFPTIAFVGLVPFLGPFLQLAVLVVFIGIFLAGQFVFPNAILADVIDYDALKTGARREAIYYGMQNTLQKFSFAASSIIFGTTLSVFGATSQNPLGIRLIGPIAGFATLLGFIIFVKGYRLSDTIQKNAKLTTK